MIRIQTGFTLPVFMSLGVLLLSACVSSGGIIKTKEGCERPAVQFIGHAREFKLSVLEKGNFNYKSNPKLYSAFSRAAKDMLIINYQVCIAKKQFKYSNNQAEWLRTKLLFFSRTEPSAKAAAHWIKVNPFPAGSAVDGRGRVIKLVTRGNCSPAVANSSNVTINCGG